MNFETATVSQVYHNTHNPLLPPGHHMPDVEAHVMSDGKLYLYGSYDDCKKEYCSNFYRVASTADMENWKVSGKVMKGEDVPWFDEDASVEESQGEPTPFIRKMMEEMEKNPELDYFGTAVEKEQKALLYAPDCMEKDGKYYLYFCMEDGSEGVAVSERPDGPFGSFVKLPCKGIDPAVFLDGDGRAYYFWGQFSANGVALNDDCCSFDCGEVVHGLVTEQEHYFHEGFSMRRIGDTYYAVFADIEHGKPTSLGYATAKSPLGPFSYGGVIIDNEGCDPSAWNNHGSIECFQGQWYVFYHRSSRNTKIHRRVCAEKIEILPDGRIPEVPMTSQGPGAPFLLEETIYGYQACGCYGKCYIDYDEYSDEEYLKVSEDGDRVIFRYLSLKKPPQKVEILGIGEAGIDIYLDHVCIGGGKMTKEKTVFSLDCGRIGGVQAEVELVFRQPKGFALRNLMFL